MKILVFSDSHDSTNGMDIAISQHPDADALIHCGDILSDAYYLEDVYPNMPLYYVRGNNDYDSTVPLSLVLPFGNHRIFVTHGHLENVKNGYDGLVKKCKQNGCDIGLFGHTHIPVHFEKDGVLLANPGSSRKGYTILMIEKDVRIINTTSI